MNHKFELKIFELCIFLLHLHFCVKGEPRQYELLTITVSLLLLFSFDLVAEKL